MFYIVNTIHTFPARTNRVVAGAARTSYDEFGYMTNGNAQVNGYTSVTQDDQMGDTRRHPLVNTNATNRFTIVNMTPEPDTSSAEAPPVSRFPTAEEEKRRLCNAYNSTGALGSSSSAQASKPVSIHPFNRRNLQHQLPRVPHSARRGLLQRKRSSVFSKPSDNKHFDWTRSNEVVERDRLASAASARQCLYFTKLDAYPIGFDALST